MAALRQLSQQHGQDLAVWKFMSAGLPLSMIQTQMLHRTVRSVNFCIGQPCLSSPQLLRLVRPPMNFPTAETLLHMYL